MLPKGILFDLDDTIVKFGAVAEPTWRSVCDEYGNKCDSLTPEILYETTNKLRRWYWDDPQRHKIGRNDLDNTRRKILAMVFEKLDIDNIPLAHEIADTYTQKRTEAMQFFPKAKQTLEELVARKVSLALITNGESHKQRNKIKRFGLEKFFKEVFIEGELGYGKPDPKVYQLALDKLNLSPDEVWSVGDNLVWDIACPQKLGIFSIWNDYKSTGLLNSQDVIPDRIINNISELLE